jgi:hypothetical protein
VHVLDLDGDFFVGIKRKSDELEDAECGECTRGNVYVGKIRSTRGGDNDGVDVPFDVPCLVEKSSFRLGFVLG